MKIFISWSGEDSKQIAEILKNFIQNVIQESEIWISSQDIAKGEKWLSSLSERLSEFDFGISVVTKTNLSAPWLLFEVGALSKSVTSKVIPILCDNIKPLELANSPLSQFQYATLRKEEMLKVLISINSTSPRPLDQPRLKQAFDMWWSSFSNSVANVKYLEPEVPEVTVSEATRLSDIESALVFVMKTLQKIDRRMQESGRETHDSKLLSELQEIGLSKVGNILWLDHNIKDIESLRAKNEGVTSAKSSPPKAE